MSKHMTPLRLKILNILAQKHMLSAKQLLEELGNHGQDVNKTSIYRSLEYLEQTGQICQHRFDAKETVYEVRHHHHDHIVCTTCGKITESDCITHPPKQVKGYTIDHHHTTMFGLCGECTKKLRNI